MKRLEPTSKGLQRLNYKGSLITYSNSDSIISDQFRTIRTNIKFLPGKKKERSILITSPGKGEGKSTTSANLAVSIDRKSTRLNSSHVAISYAVFCLKKKKS